MARVHLIFGLLLFVVFLITGQYMRADFPDKDAIDQTLRLLMRSRHHLHSVFRTDPHWPRLVFRTAA